MEDGVAVICGGVVSMSKFLSDPMAYLMCIILEDKDYEEFVKLINEGRDKEARKLVRERGMSAI